MDIPVSFDYKGKHYEGTFSDVSGAAAKMWHLTINKYHRGQLLLLERGWVFFSNDHQFEELADYFGEVVSRNSFKYKTAHVLCKRFKNWVAKTFMSTRKRRAKETNLSK